jgi:hypothetical protein
MHTLRLKFKSILHRQIHCAVTMVGTLKYRLGSNQVLLILYLGHFTTTGVNAVETVAEGHLAHLLLNVLTATLLVDVPQVLTLLIFHLLII